ISKVAGSDFCGISCIALPVWQSCQHHKSILDDIGMPSRWHENGGLKRFDHSWTCYLEAQRHPSAIIDRRLDLARFTEPYLASGLNRLRGDVGRYVADHQRRYHANRGDANIDDFYRLGAIVMAIGLQMARVKCFGNFLQARLINWVGWNRNRELVGLTLVTGINRTFEAPMLGGDAGVVGEGTSLILQCQEGGF